MEKNPDEKKYVGKAKSCNNGSGPKVRNEPIKRKSFSVNEAVISLDQALGRLKKRKGLREVPGEGGAGALRPHDMFTDSSSRCFNASPAPTDASLLSMNFSHYELMRNLSRCTSNSEGAYSGATCSTHRADPSLKDEHLEKYFRSVETWRRKNPPNGDSPATCSHYTLSDK